MPDESSNEPTDLQSASPGVGRRDAHPPMPRDKRGWHVAPAPDGRGMPEQAPSGPPAHRRPGFLWFVLLLIALNWLSVLLFQPSTRRAAGDGPLQPVLPAGGHRPGRSSRSRPRATRSRARSRPSCATRRATRRRRPRRCSRPRSRRFWNGSQLSALLQEEGGEDQRRNRRPRSQSLLAELLLGFGPTLLIVGLFVLIARRAAKGGGAMGALGNFGRSQARRVDPEKIRVTFDDVAGIDEAKARADGDRRLPAQPRALRPPRRADAARRAALGRPGHRQDAARAGRRRRGARGVLLDLRLGVHRGDRGRRAPRACATCSPRPRRPPRRSSSSTSSTRSGARARARCRSPGPTTSASRRSTRSSPRSTASSPPRRWSCSPPPTVPTCSTPRCCAPGASTGA